LLDVTSYDVALDLTSAADTFRGRSVIRFRCKQPGATTFAEIDALTMHEVMLNGDRIDVGTAIRDGRLYLHGLEQTNVLAVDADFAVWPDDHGLSKYTDEADGQQYVLVNSFPTAAGRAFCCFDQPDLRADLTLSVAAPAGWHCVSNGAAVERPTAGASGTWRFATVPAMKPYELTLCAGPYIAAPANKPSAADAHAASGADPSAPVQLAVFCRPILADSPGLARIAGIVSQVVDRYAQWLGVPCPYDKLDIVFAPGLGPTAMQIPAVMYVSETLLQRASDPGDNFVAIVLAHEAAHLWFGCMVEGGWWDDLWLAEAMATYLSYEVGADALHIPDAWAEFAMTGKAWAYQADDLPSTQPVASAVETAADALTRPAAITYNKGASVIRQLAALIGDQAMRTGLRVYLTKFTGSATTLSDLVDCWSAASGRDLHGWAAEWLQAPGTNTLRSELIAGTDGTIEAASLVQGPPPAGGPIRTHELAVSVFAREGPQLTRRHSMRVLIDGDRVALRELVGLPPPAALIVNDADLTFATTNFDDVTLASLSAAAMNVGDALTETMCWNSAWHMVRHAQLGAASFCKLVARRLSDSQPITGLEHLLERAISAANWYADPVQRADLLAEVAAAALAAAELQAPGSRDQRLRVVGFASAATNPAQLELLGTWLKGASLPAGVVLDLELRAKILPNLAARGMAADSDLSAYAAADPVAGQTLRATWAAHQPSLESKERAWAAALASRRADMARAHATGFWVPGQEQLVGQFRERYFSQALPAIRNLEARTAQRLARALYPATLADEATLAATSHELDQTSPTDPTHDILLEQREITQRVMAARTAAKHAAGSQTSTAT